MITSVLFEVLFLKGLFQSICKYGLYSSVYWGEGGVKTSTDVYISGVYLMERECPFLFSGLVGDVCLWLLLLGMLHPEQAGYPGGIDEAFHSHCVSCNN